MAAERLEEVREQMRRLDGLATVTLELCRKVPPARRRDVYHWRQHVALVRGEATERLARAEALASDPS